MTRPTYDQFARNWELYKEYEDPDIGMFEHEFNNLTYEQRVERITDQLGPEEDFQDSTDYC